MPENITPEDAKAFLAKVNEGRKAFDLPELTHVDFDGAEPQSVRNCLSARNLIGPIAGGQAEPCSTGYESSVGEDHFHLPVDKEVKLADVFGVESVVGGVAIPEEIKRVTDAFDATSIDKGGMEPPDVDREQLAVVRRAFEDAGLLED